MKPFDVSKPVQTSDGRPARIRPRQRAAGTFSGGLDKLLSQRQGGAPLFLKRGSRSARRLRPDRLHSVRDYLQRRRGTMIKLYKPGGRVSVWKDRGVTPAAVEGRQILGFGFVNWPEYCSSGKPYYAFRSPKLQGPFVSTRRVAFLYWLANHLDSYESTT